MPAVALRCLWAIYQCHEAGRESVNWVDLALLCVVVISALLAFVRGFVREALGIAAWAGAAYASLHGIDLVRGPLSGMGGSPEMTEIIGHAAVFIVALVVLMIASGVIAQAFHSIGLGALDRSLGVVFGAARGAALLVAAYIGSGWVMVPERWPEPVRQARLLPIIAEAATWTAEQIPERYRPSVPIPPPVPFTRSLDLLQAVPLGRPVPNR